MPPAEIVRPRLLDWTDTERLTTRLAALLRERIEAVGGEPVTYAAIPRGGLFVLGSLAYLLGVPPDRIAASPRGGSETSGTLVVVDDCALSGARLAAALDRIFETDPDRRVIVAHLFSHPELRRRVEAVEPNVTVCLAAADLVERDDLPDEVRDGFEQRWRERVPGRRYWLGAVEPIAFPWSEPESVWWDAREARLEDGWRRSSPRRFLRSRAELGLPPEAGDDAHRAPGTLDLAPGCLWKLEPGADGERLLVRGPDGRLLGFSGTALEIWRALLAEGTREAATRRLTELYDVGEAEAGRDVDELVDELVARGLLADS